MSENINIVARRIFNKLSEDISDRRGLKQEWSSISPNVMKLEIRRTWEQIFTEEIEKHANELQSKVSDLEEANRSNRIVMSALQNAHEMEKARVKRLEETLDTLTAVVGLTPVLGNKEALQEAFNAAVVVLNFENQGESKQ